MMASCATSPSGGGNLIKYTPHPVEPNWVNFTRKPVISSAMENGKKNYKVSDQFVEKALQANDYIKRIKKWKKDNVIP